MSRWLWLAAGLAVLVGVGIGVVLIPRPASPPAVVREAPGQAPQAATEGRSNKPATAPSQLDSAPASGSPSAWRRIDPAQVDVGDRPKHRQTVAGRVLVQIAADLSVLKVGDNLALPVPQDAAVFEARIEQAHPGIGGARAFTGSLASAGAGRFVLTVGPRSTFANLTTPGGRYELVGNRRYAWLMPSANMDRDVDYSVPDYHPRRNTPPEPERRPG